jgi:hypothetical protein
VTKLEEAADAYKKAYVWATRCRAWRNETYHYWQLDINVFGALYEHFTEAKQIMSEADAALDGAHRRLHAVIMEMP